MSERPLVIISTRLPPAICGIGTYSWLLREHWPNESRPIEFLLVEGAGESPAGDRLTQFGNSASLLDHALQRIGAADLLLHYAGRAYHPLGFPLWLPVVLANWKRHFPGARLTIFVHELPGKLAPTSRHFWLGKMNERVVKLLAQNADALVTNTENHLGRLRKLTQQKDITLVPISSNIEPDSDGARGLRAPAEFVLFGLPFGRLQTLRLYQKHLPRWAAAGILTKLHLIGPDDETYSRQAEESLKPLAAVVVRHGVLPSAEISQVLRRSGFALTNASTETWSKSTTFMAAVAHGCPVVIVEDGVLPGPLREAVRAEEIGTLSEPEVERRATALRAWYEANASWDVTARQIAQLCGESGAA